MRRRSWILADAASRATACVLALLAFAAAPMVGAVGPAAAQAVELNWPSKQTVRPRDLMLSYPCGGGRICSLNDYMDRQHACALMVVSGGDLVLYRTSVRSADDPCKTAVDRDRYGIASITKSIVSLLFGLVYADPGYAPPANLDSSAADILTAAGLPKYDSRVTLRQLLHMASGMEWSEDEIDAILKVQVDQNGDLVGKWRRLKDSVKERLERAKFFGPGQFRYSGFDSQLIGIITERRLTADKGFVRGTLDEALEHLLWQRLPVARKAEWNADFAGHPAAHCCAYTSIEDLSALGEWLLSEYNEGEDAAADWIRASVTDSIDPGWSCSFAGTERKFRYGYQWWIPSDDEQDGFAGIGTEGQYLHVFPQQNVVIVQFGEKLAGDADTCEAMLVHRLIADQVNLN
jgi:CubicO group peptidase (beta-lactamase class C family)